MCQLVVCTFLLSLMACSGHVQETSRRNKSTDGNLKNLQSYQLITGPKLISRKFTTRSLYTFNKNNLISHKVSSTRNFSTLKTRTLEYSVLFNSRTLNLHKLNNHTTHSPTLRTRTLNSSTLNSRTLNYDMVNPYIPETLNAELENKNRDNLVYDKIVKEWLEDTILKLPDNDLIDSRRSLNEGLHDHKKRVIKEKEESRIRAENFDDNDIILNNEYELDKLRVHDPVMPNFDESFADIAAKKINEIKSEHLKVKLEEESSKSARRFDQTTKKPNSLDRILDLMDQFLFQAHSKLINGELLKLKYRVYVKYKIGYVFSLLRILKQHQMRIYSTMHFYQFYTPKVKGTKYVRSLADLTFYLSLYEKLTRLDDDIVTLVTYLLTLDKERKKEAAIEATKFPKRYKATPRENEWWWHTLRVPKYG